MLVPVVVYSRDEWRSSLVAAAVYIVLRRYASVCAYSPSMIGLSAGNLTAMGSLVERPLVVSDNRVLFVVGARPWCDAVECELDSVFDAVAPRGSAGHVTAYVFPLGAKIGGALVTVAAVFDALDLPGPVPGDVAGLFPRLLLRDVAPCDYTAAVRQYLAVHSDAWTMMYGMGVRLYVRTVSGLRRDALRQLMVLQSPANVRIGTEVARYLQSNDIVSVSVGGSVMVVATTVVERGWSTWHPTQHLKATAVSTLQLAAECDRTRRLFAGLVGSKVVVMGDRASRMRARLPGWGIFPLSTVRLVYSTLPATHLF
jgi:hypothetical protein